jgi:hypothetical protein
MSRRNTSTFGKEGLVFLGIQPLHCGCDTVSVALFASTHFRIPPRSFDLDLRRRQATAENAGTDGTLH